MATDRTYPNPLRWHPELGDDTRQCMKCARELEPGKGCRVRVIHGGASLLASGRGATDDEAVGDMWFFRVGAGCMRKVPKAYRWPAL